MNKQLEEMDAFIKRTEKLFIEGPERARTLPDNTVQVWPGGATFKTIQAAIDSVKDASPTNPYSISVGNGTYKENVQMKSNVFVFGSGQDNTIITAPPGQTATGVVNTAGDSGMADLTVNATGGIKGSWVISLKMQLPGNFKASAVTLNSNDGGLPRNNIRGVVNMINSSYVAGTLHLSGCIVNAIGTGVNAISVAMEGYGTDYMATVNLTTIKASSPPPNLGDGVATGGTHTVTLTESTITGEIYALDNRDWKSLITANQCTINGPVSPGVIINKVQSEAQGEASEARQTPVNMPE